MSEFYFCKILERFTANYSKAFIFCLSASLPRARPLAEFFLDKKEREKESLKLINFLKRTSNFKTVSLYLRKPK